MTNNHTEYYLSAYLTPPGQRSVISPRHDHNLALWRHSDTGIELVRHWELERISGQKHHSWPLYTLQRAHDFLADLLAGEGIEIGHIRASWGTPGLPAYQELPIPAGAQNLPIHSLAHLFSGLLLDTRIFKTGNIIGMAIDAAPDLVLETELPEHYYAGCASIKGKLHFAPVESPAPLYHAADRTFGKEPGTLMALATASCAEIEFDVESAMTEIELFGGRVQPWAAAFGLVKRIIEEAKRQLSGRTPDDRFTDEENLQSAVMKVVQACCELLVARNIERLCELGGVRPDECYLSMSGGFALNCQANTEILDRFSFRGLLTPPCANDSGVGLGLGLLGLYGSGLFDKHDLTIETAYYGNDLGDVDEALADFGAWVAEVQDFSPRQFVEDITDNVIVWVDGPAEMGPRALGHRSLLGDPRAEKVKDLLNDYKQRQWWRPVAPIVLAEYAGEWFRQARPSPFMLEAAEVLESVREKVPAILHLDGTARHQTLTERQNPLLYRAIDEFRSATGVPILCNTSLNDKSEPIVDSVAQALTFCVRKGIQIAYVAGRRVVLHTTADIQSEVPDRPLPRSTGYFSGQEDDRDAIWRQWLDQGYSEASLLLMTGTPQFLTDPETFTPSRVSLLAERIAGKDPAFEQNLDAFRTEHGPGTVFDVHAKSSAP